MEKIQVKKGDRGCQSIACDLCVDEDRLEAWMAVAKQARPAMFPRPVRHVNRAELAIARQESVFSE